MAPVRPASKTLLALVAASLLLSAAVAAAAPAAPRTRSRVATPGPLPDSVLAEVGHGRRVTVSGFHHAWKQVAPPARPDSLTPESARQFLDLLVDKEALAEAAAARGYRLNPRDSSEWLALRDRLTLQVVLDSAMAAAARAAEARGEPTPSRDQLGVMARDSAMVLLGARFEREAIEALLPAWRSIPRPSPDSSLMAQIRVLGTMPAVAPADTARALAHSAEGDYLVSDLLASWKRLSPMYRPRIETADALQDLVENGLFERHLRRRAEARGDAGRPEVAAELAKNREFKHVGYLVNAEVYDHIATDSLALRRWFEAHRSEFTLPLRLRVVRLSLGNEAEARESLGRLATRAAAESLAAAAARSGLQYAGEISAASDSALFAAGVAAGTDAVIGPVAVREGWAIARVMAVLPAREREWGEVRGLVQHRYEQEQAETGMRALIERARSGRRIVLNEAALARLAGGS